MRKSQKLLNEIENCSNEMELEARLDAYYSLENQRKSNQRKNMVGYYVIAFLMKHPGRHYTQSQLQNMLFNDHYIDVERKSLSRWVHLIDSEDIGIHSTSDEGTWYDGLAFDLAA